MKEMFSRCRGCGKKISSEDFNIIRISGGRLHSLESFEEDPDLMWGYMHESCFLLAIGDRRAILEPVMSKLKISGYKK